MTTEERIELRDVIVFKLGALVEKQSGGEL